MSRVGKPLPPPLRPGAKVGVFALASAPKIEHLDEGLAILRDAGYEPVLAPNIGKKSMYLAGDDFERVAGLEFLLDCNVEALLAVRGGYGITRILPSLEWERLAAWGGWVVGFSDVTALHAALSTRFPFATLHGPMALTLARNLASTDALLAWLRGQAPERLFALKPKNILRPGKARGIAVGGTLALLASLIGTPYEPEYRDAVVFVEDIGEPGYRMDRLLTQLRLSHRLKCASAVVGGRLSQCGRGEEGWRERWRELLVEVAPVGAPVLVDLPFGHGALNTPIPLGAEVVVDTERGEVVWGGD